MDGLVIVPDNY